MLSVGTEYGPDLLEGQGLAVVQVGRFLVDALELRDIEGSRGVVFRRSADIGRRAGCVVRLWAVAAGTAARDEDCFAAVLSWG